MASRLVKVGGVYNTPVREYVVDSRTDLADCEGELGDRAYITDESTEVVCSSDGWPSSNDNSET